MKKITTLLLALITVANVFGQDGRRIVYKQILDNVSLYSTGGNTPLVLNTTTHLLEYSKPGLIASIESDSARNYNFTGSLLCKIKWTVRDTVNLVKTNYTTNQKFTFVVVASGADTTVFIPNLGTVNGAATYTLTGTNNSITWYFDGTNYWIIK